MKKIIQVLLCTALTINTIYAHTNKTFLMPRSQGVNLALETSAGWNELIHRNAPDRFGGHLQVAVFFQGSTSKEDTGKFFGLNEHNKVTIGAVSIAGSGGDISNTITGKDFDALYTIHTFNNNISTVGQIPTTAATAIFAPKQTTYGTYLNYYQNLDTLVKGLYLNVVMPIVRVKNEPDFVVTGALSSTLQSFFAGTYQKAPTDANAQDPLKFGLITESQTVQTGIADIDLLVGYTCWDKQYGHASLNLGFTIPTGNEPKGIYLFEAVVGNGTHYGFGVGGDAWVRLWGNYEHNIKAFFKTNYRYLFGSTETRTLGLKNRNWGQYLLLGSTLAGENDRAIPAANILTRSVEVTPGNQVDLVSGFSYNLNNLSFDLGYNFFLKGREAVTLNNNLPEQTYGVLARNHNFTSVFTGATGQIDNGGPTGGTTLTTNDIDLTVAETPRQITHKVFVGAAYRVDTWDIPVVMGLGGHVEIATDNAAMDTWGAFGKAAIKF